MKLSFARLGYLFTSSHSLTVFAVDSVVFIYCYHALLPAASPRRRCVRPGDPACASQSMRSGWR